MPYLFTVVPASTDASSTKFQNPAQLTSAVVNVAEKHLLYARDRFDNLKQD